MSLPSQSRPDFLQSRLFDSGPAIATICGTCFGGAALLLQGLASSHLPLIDQARLKLLILLFLSCASGIVSIAATQRLSPTFPLNPARWGRLGISAGMFCSTVGGGTLAFAATLEAINAKTTALDQALRMQAWLVLAVCVAALLPSVLCGFVGGVIGSSFATSPQAQKSPSATILISPWLKWIQFSIAAIAFMGFASPICLMVKAPVVDPPPLVITPPPEPPAPPPFRYEPPEGISSARMGEIQPDFTKVIPDVQSTCPVAMSPDGVMIAYGDSAGAPTAIGVFDLHRFSMVTSIQLPTFPHGVLAWSPDQKSIACTLGEGQSRRIWILSIREAKAIELPRPPGRDVPNGELYWWSEHELAFFPDDEAPLAFDLEKLLLTSLVDSPHYKKLDEPNQKKWMDGPRSEWPGQTGWRLGLRTLITSAVPPARRNPEAPWELSGLTIGAYEHPKLPLAYGIRPLKVDEEDRIVCSQDGSKVAHLRDSRIEVTYMKKAACPDLMIEVEMPQTPEEVASNGWSSRLESKELCLMICAPLKNPLNQALVGPDFQHVHGLARLHEWKGRKAVFILPTYDGNIQPDDVASTLHSWYSGKMSEWKAPGTLNWWAPIRFISSPLPEKIGGVELPQLLSFEQEPTSLRVTKAVEKPRPTPPTETPEPPSATPPPPPVPVTEEDVKAFLTEHHAKASRGDVTGMMADYDSTVDFLDKGSIPVASIEAEERAQRQKWPKGSEQIVGVIRVSEYVGGWASAYTIAFSNENVAGEWHKGRADLMLNLRTEGTRLYISSQKAKVYDVTDNKASISKPPPPTTPAKSVSKSALITVPKPCFVTVFQAKDAPQIEITDYISFQNGIMWHRTYRELSKDGKVLRSCRAIYTGSGGLAPDKSTARIYVETQEWDPGMGSVSFTGICQRSAASLVGKSYQFRFITGGMVESQLGMVFQLLN